jgi:hypothetical protein
MKWFWSKSKSLSWSIPEDQCERHEWNGTCQCKKCGKTDRACSAMFHSCDNGVCIRCGVVVVTHDQETVSPIELACNKCGAKYVLGKNASCITAEEAASLATAVVGNVRQQLMIGFAKDQDDVYLRHVRNTVLELAPQIGWDCAECFYHNNWERGIVVFKKAPPPPPPPSLDPYLSRFGPDQPKAYCAKCGEELASSRALTCLHCGFTWYQCPACHSAWERCKDTCHECHATLEELAKDVT